MLNSKGRILKITCLEYADCIPCREIRALLSQKRVSWVLYKTEFDGEAPV